MTDALDVDSRRTLDERARRLAAPASEQQERDVLVAAVFEVDGTPYGVDVSRVREVLPAGPVARLPDVGGALFAIRAVRGEILCLAGAGHLLGGDVSAEPTGCTLVLDGESPVGLMINSDVTLVTLDEDDLHPVPSRSPLIGAVSGSGVALLDVDAVVTDPRLVIAQESGRAREQPAEEPAEEGRNQP